MEKEASVSLEAVGEMLRCKKCLMQVTDGDKIEKDGKVKCLFCGTVNTVPKKMIGKIKKRTLARARKEIRRASGVRVNMEMKHPTRKIKTVG